MLIFEKIPYKGWANCLRLSNDTVELVITTDVGPRIIHFGWKSQDHNVFYQDPKTLGKTGGDRWHLYGGHRFWHAPEVKPRTYVPDNSPVSHEWDGSCLRLTQDTEQLTGLQKTIEILLDEHRSSLTIHHQLTNNGQWEITTAPWALSVMAPGGTSILPQEPFIPFPDELLPARPLVLWHYTDMSDPRFTWSKKYVGLKQDATKKDPMKYGVQNSVGWGCYVNDDTAFIKSTSHKPDATYPDYGCNWELYTNSNFLELETLGALQPIKPGASVEHVEQWSLARVNTSGNLDSIFQQIQDINTAKS